ncbi:complex I NDUFA9 subunit family protein [Natronomonas sp. EA1]|uniref:complex I NDUFA9 subunit family protein n=1 Tax=Natronomonas sp. EA1 TaxID=3421655 RepID=UPI003EB9D202
MNVLVTGGTGFIGTYLCEELARRGHDVTALARTPGDADFDGDVATVAGDVTDRDSLEGAFEGQDVVVNLVALSPLFRPKGGNEKHFEIHLGGTEHVVEAAEEHGVSKLVQLSALGADPDGDTAYIQAKGQAEDVVKKSTLDWVIFRPSVVFGDGGEFVPFTKKLAPPYLTPLPGGGKTRFQPIWVGDLVPMIADAVEGSTADAETAAEETETADDDGEPVETGGATQAIRRVDAAAEDENEGEDPHVGRIYEVGGPETLTLAQVARLAHAADNKPVSVVPVPMPLAGIGLSMLDLVPGAPMGSDQYKSLKFDNTTSNNAVEAFGYDESELTTLADYLGVDPDVATRR